MESKGGATLLKLRDQSILATGKNPLGDTYTIVAKTEVTQVSAIRLEAMTHRSLPNQGPGRSEQTGGNFAMVKFAITAHTPGTQPRPIEVSRVAADHHFLELTANQWNLQGGQGRSRTAVYLAKQPVDCKDGTRLEFQMEFSASAEWPLENLGRFRLSVSSDPAAFDVEQTRFAAMKLTDPWAKLAVAYAVNGRHDEATRYLTRALERSLGRKARTPILELAAHFDDLLPALIERQPDEPQLQMALARSLARRGKQHLAEDQPATAQAELEKSREILARLRAKYPEPEWTVLKPTELKSERGQTLTLQADGSILASGTNPDRDTYTLTAPIAGGTVAGLRLETIPDDRLKGDASRWWGEFFLTEIDLATVAAGGGADRPLAIKDGVADFSKDEHPLSRAFDHDDSTSWGVWPRHTEPHVAIFECASSSAATAVNQRLKVRLRSGSGTYPGRNLGRFRLSVASHAQDLMLAANLRNDIKDSEIADLNVELAKAHAEQGHESEAMALLVEAFLLADRAGKARIITEAAPLAGALEKLAERAADDALFQAELARHFAARGNVAAANAARARACVLFAEKLAQEPENTALATDILLAYQSAGRTREAVPYLARASAANPNDSLLSLNVAALQAWFGEEKELTATLQRIRTFAKDTDDAGTAERAAKACSIRASTDKAELDAVLAFARKGVELDHSSEWREWRLLALGMAEYRSGNHAAAIEALLAAAKAGSNNPIATGISAFYRAMSLSRQGKSDEARKLAIGAAAQMKPLPKDEQNPPANDAYWDDLILWLAYKEAKAMIHFDAAPSAPETPDAK